MKVCVAGLGAVGGLLAARLDLDDALVKHLHATVSRATETVPVAAG